MAQTVFVNKKFCYIPIHKNASNWTKNFLSTNCSFVEKTYEISELLELKKNYIILLRDPVDRWVSGTAQWFHSKRELYPNTLIDDYIIDPILFEMLIDAVGIDAHTHPQIDFLHGIVKDKTFFFDVNDQNFEKNFLDFITKKINKSFTLDYNYRNHSEPSTFKMNIIKQLRNKLRNKSNIEKLKKYYNQDISFIKTCHFYQKSESGI